jgi:phospholipid/cholesterol/gamma-HCH transport system substrate-binding protein
MRLSNEMRVGLLALGAAAIGIWGFYFLKGRSLFSHTTTLYAEYDNLNGLQKSALVVINGLKIGTVTKTYLKEDGSGKIMVRMEIEDGITIPKCAVAKIKSPDLMGAKQMSIEFDIKSKTSPCGPGSTMAIDGDTLTAASANLMESFLNTDLDPIMASTEVILDSAKYWVAHRDRIKEVQSLSQSIKGIQSTVDNLSQITSKVNGLIVGVAGGATKTINNLADATGNLKDNNSKITATLQNAQDFSAKLKNLPLEQTIGEANKTVKDLQLTLQKFNATIEGLNAIIADANAGKGTLGALLKDKQLYSDLQLTNLQIQLLIQDFRRNPKRYTTILSGKSAAADPDADAIKQLQATEKALYEELKKKYDK